MNRKKITMKDIAEKTGFSVNTVSHALNGKSDISPATVELIKNTAKELGYIGNSSASFLRSGKSRTVAVILGDIANPHFSVLVKDIEAYLRKAGYTAIILNTDEDELRERSAIISAVEKNVDGILICPVQKTPDNIEFLQQTGVPFVLIGRRFDDIQTDYVVCDDVQSGYLAAKHLLKCGHKNVMFLNGPGYVSSAVQRLEGAVRAFEEFKAKPPKVITGSIKSGGWSRILKQELINDNSITALIAFSDLIAWESIRALSELSLCVPRDISVVGFDNIQSRFMVPVDLTSVSSSKGRMADTAAEILLGRISGETGESRIVLPVRLLKGSTVRNLND